jgi:hypothetical protein
VLVIGVKYEILFRSNIYCIDYICDPLICVGLAVHGPGVQMEPLAWVRVSFLNEPRSLHFAGVLPREVTFPGTLAASLIVDNYGACRQ